MKGSDVLIAFGTFLYIFTIFGRQEIMWDFPVSGSLRIPAFFLVTVIITVTIIALETLSYRYSHRKDEVRPDQSLNSRIYQYITRNILVIIIMYVINSEASYLVISLGATITIVVLAKSTNKYLKTNTVWKNLSTTERFIFSDVLVILILTFISVVGLEEYSNQAILAEGLRLAGMRIITRVLGVALIGWAGNAAATQIQLKNAADRQLVLYGMVFPAEVITLMIFRKTFIQWLLGAFWLDLSYGLQWEFLILIIMILLLLWGRMRLSKREKRIMARVQLK